VSNGTPTLASVGDVARVRVQIPLDVQPIIQQQPVLAARWRDITRRTIGERLAAGYRVSAFVRADEAGDSLPYYVLART
jgi:predicted GNAT superfamily acetyltransferase